MAIRWDKLTVKAQEAVQRANDLASEHGNPEVQPVHILAALLEDHEGIVAPLLERVGLHAANGAGRGHARDRAACPRFRAAAPRRRISPMPPSSCWRTPSKRRPTSRTSTSPPSTCCSA